MRVGIYPGSFDPITLGHLDIIKRSSKMVDKLIIAVLNNSAKKAMFSADERVALIRETVKDIPNVSVEQFEGLTVDFARKVGANVMFRGLRAVTDFEYEIQIAQTNHAIAPDIDTLFLTTSVKYSFLSSSIVKEISMYKESVEQFVPECVAEALIKKFK
ncbi:MAG: pantetheine-phosphate adenylyltransferase [Lachnospiraceae bacterium]|jgi:pantetheine-phosphate adenylyltransferase|nr:pantetheine-phosphate adenylyltransferase [Lachnospiraceae bacterium]HAP33815.1 pantetheine-phosphate adenylyltransferase [Lachnospiraceae bacterium]HBR05454.1 pantetheine-phosphate adenylyltransferase [Lachnospiraceae bacterium]HBZ89808.1 pantetheine-phosphate adenylyltransferase [Lachnospiraceae bacterium]